MSHSEETRIKNAELALKLMVEDLGEERIYGAWFPADESPLDQTFRSAWEYLQRQGYVRRGPALKEEYVLTPSGWLKGMELTGALRSEETLQKVQQLMAGLKEYVKDRNQEGFDLIETIAGKVGLAKGFVHNIMASCYIEQVLGRQGAELDSEQGHAIRIPSDFGDRLIREL